MKYRALILPALLTFFAAAGLIDSFIIHHKEIESFSNPATFDRCSINALFNCASVAKSSYAKLFGMPVSVYGALFYQAALMFGVALLAGFRPPRWFMLATSAVAIFSLLFSFRLLYLSYFGLGVFCLYCLVSNVTTLGIVATWFAYYFRTQKEA